MDRESHYKLLDAVGDHFRTYYESAQERFPSALVMLANGQSVASLREISRIKPDLLNAVKNIGGAEVGGIFTDMGGVTEADPYIYQRLYQRHCLYRDVPDDLLERRENLRRTGYVIMGHAQEARRHERHGMQGYIARALLGDLAFHRSSSYMAHMEEVFENARAISEAQAKSLGRTEAYDANLEDFTPGIETAAYRELLQHLKDEAVQSRNGASGVDISPLPEFTVEQAQRLVDLVCELLPVDDTTFQTHLLEGIPSMCMGNIATIRYTPNPFTLLETVFHERIGHLTYRQGSDDTGGIQGFHMDEARALSLERFLLREFGMLEHVSDILGRSYGEDHTAFATDNLMIAANGVSGNMSERVAADDLTYIIQETIRGQAELDVMSGRLKVTEMPDFLAAETEEALGFSGLNGYHLMRETFQWPLCMHGHVSSYPQGMVIAAQLHAAAKLDLSEELTDLSAGADSAYFQFKSHHVDRHGATKSAKDIVEDATGAAYLDTDPLIKYVHSKISGKNDLGQKERPENVSAGRSKNTLDL